MSVSIPNWIIQQFSANVHFLSEQSSSRFLSSVVEEPDVGSEAKAVDRIGTTQDAPDQINNRHGDTPIGNTPHSRRWLFPVHYEVPADLIDKQDRVMLLTQPDGPYTIRHAGVMGRGIDDAIVSALGGSAVEGQYGPNSQGTAVALPAAQKIAVGSTGLTIAKLIEAQEILGEADVDDIWPRYCFLTHKQVSDLLNEDKITNADYNNVRTLVDGNVVSFMGFQMRAVSTKRMPTIASTVRGVYCFAKPAVRIGFAIHPTSAADERPDKRKATQIYTWGSWGAVRVEDEMVVQVACSEA